MRITILSRASPALLAVSCLLVGWLCQTASADLLFGGPKGWKGWTTTGDSFHDGIWQRLADPYPTHSHYQSGEMQTGTLRSPTFRLEADILKLHVNGWDGRTGGPNLTGFELRLASDGAVLRRLAPPQQDTIVPMTWIVSDLKGKEVYIEAFDRHAAGGFAWIGLAAVESAEMDVPAASSTFYAVVLPTSLGAWSLLDFDGARQKTPLYLSTLGGGEAAVGGVRSPEFTISVPKIRLAVRGHDGQSGGQTGSTIDLVSSADGSVLRSSVAPQSDSPKWIEWDVSDLKGRTVHIRLVDTNNSNTFAWMGLDEVDAGPDLRVRFAENPSLAGWSASGAEKAYAECGGVPFMVEPSSALSERGLLQVKLGFSARRLLLCGMTHSLDQGNPVWGDPRDLRSRFFVGDKIGEIRVSYKGGAVDVYPIILGESAWWGKRFVEAPEPFASDPKAKSALERALRLYPPVPSYRYVASLSLRSEPVESVEVSGVKDKAGVPVVLGITAEAAPGASLPGCMPLPHPKLTPEAAAFLESRSLRLQGKDEKAAEANLQALRDAFYTTLTNFPKSVKLDIPATYRGPKVKLEGDVYAQILTNVFYHNLNDMAAKVTDDGMYHTSTKGAATWGGYEGLGTYQKNYGSYFTHTWSRDMGRALGELVAFGLLDKARICADYVFRMARLWETGRAPDGSDITYKGLNLPRHVCRIMNLPNARPGEGCFENDGHGLTGLFIYNLWRKLPDRDAWLKANWEDVKGLGDWVTWQLDHPEISGATKTLQTDSECSGGIGHSVYADMACREALRGLGEMAWSIDEKAKAVEWGRTAERLREGCLAEYVVDDPNYGKVWTLKSTGWPNQSTVLGPVLFVTDKRGFAPTDDEPAWRRITAAACQRLIDTYKPFGYYGVAMGYGQGFVTQTALLLDRMADATTMLQWAAKCTYNANFEPYIVPEGCEVEPGGRFWHRTGDLGNGVQQAEIVKAIRLIIGIDDNKPGRLCIMPRLPYGWTGISISDYPAVVGFGAEREVVPIGYDLQRKGDSMTLSVKAAKPLGDVSLRLGPFKMDPSGRKVLLNGKPARATMARSGDSWWASAVANVGTGFTVEVL